MISIISFRHILWFMRRYSNLSSCPTIEQCLVFLRLHDFIPKPCSPPLYWKQKRSVRDLNQKLQTSPVTYFEIIEPKHISSNRGMCRLLNLSWLSHKQIPQPLLFIEINLLSCCVVFPLLVIVLIPLLVSKNMMKKENIAQQSKTVLKYRR